MSRDMCAATVGVDSSFLLECLRAPGAFLFSHAACTAGHSSTGITVQHIGMPRCMPNLTWLRRVWTRHGRQRHVCSCMLRDMCIACYSCPAGCATVVASDSSVLARVPAVLSESAFLFYHPPTLRPQKGSGFQQHLSRFLSRFHRS